MNDKIKSYPKTKMFSVIDTIGVPHPYMISSRHVVHAADHFSGRLGEAAIDSAEKHGIYCEICRKKGQIMPHSEHKQALLVKVNDPEKRELKDVPNLDEYLLSIKEKCEADGFVGFAFTL